MNNHLDIYCKSPKKNRITAVILGCIPLLFFIFFSEKKASKTIYSVDEKHSEVQLKESNPKKIVTAQIAPALKKSKKPIIHNAQTIPHINWHTAKVKKGDSLARIFKRLGLSSQTTHAVINAKGGESKLLKKLQIGASVRMGINGIGKLEALEYPLSKTETLYINLIGDSYKSKKENKEIEIRESFSHGVISSSFWNAGVNAGLSNAQVINFTDIFGWDINFAQNIRQGDSFNAVFEKKYVDGEYIGTGNILAAKFVNQGETFQAIRFTDGKYYTPDGKSMRKAFLRSPVNFKYIISNFNPRRFHPIQKRWQAHRGTDYAAKTGTPVVAAGNGKVVKATYDKYNGHHVFLQHGNGIETKYIHFSKRAVKKGQHVKQGQLIGYVGGTGLAEAPHLHYEFHINGVPRNPRTVKLPDAQPIANEYKTKFFALAKKRIETLNGVKNIALFNEASSAHASD